VPAKNPFLSSSQICIYIDGILKKETDFKIPNFNEPFTHIRIGAACSHTNNNNQQTNISNLNITKTLTTPLSNFRNVFSLGYKSGLTRNL